ncbi:hypothetical protein TI03_00020 [Achromatium sp. WMS1]|nr:hypothetical protein TI03_00020 [Achromatium sp. WMS1]
MLLNRYRLTSLMLVVSLYFTSSYAEVVTDGSVGAAGSISGPNYAIPQSLGTTSGTNLFHSFGTFNIGSGETATFTGSSALTNVISRVTGGSASTINGTIDSMGIPNANFFFINPAGVIFGAGAQINVPADFHVSTANTLNFADGTVFEAGSATTPILTTADPSSFGFATNPTGEIKIENGNLTFSNGGNVSFSGDSITSSSSVNLNNGTSLRVYGRGTTANVVVPLTGDLPAGNGEITVSDGHWRALNGGNIQISGGAIQIGGSAGGEVLAETDSSSNAGSVTIKAESLIVGDQGIFSAGVDGSTGDVGGITLNVSGELQVKNGAEISAYSFGNVGAVTINAGSLIVDGGTSYEPTRMVSAVRGGSGNSDDFTINVSGAMQVLNGAWVGTAAYGRDNAGNISVTAGNLTVDSSDIDSETKSTGHTGNITINVAETMEILNGAWVNTATKDQGDAGSITVTAKNLIIDSGHIMAEAIPYYSDVTGPHLGTGNTGVVNVEVTELLQIRNNSQIESVSIAGSAGVVTVKAANLEMSNGLIASNRDGYESTTGDTGGVVIDVTGDMTVSGYRSEGGDSLPIAIAAFNGGIGNAGSVTMDVGGTLTLIDTGIATYAQSGTAGNIYIDPPAIKITNSRITTSGTSGGNIDLRGVDSNSTLYLDGSLIQANASDGNVYIDMVIVDNVTVGNPASNVIFLNGAQGSNVTFGDTARMVFTSSQNQIQAGGHGTITLAGGEGYYEGHYHDVTQPPKSPTEEEEDEEKPDEEEEEENNTINLANRSIQRMLPNPCDNTRKLRIMGRGGMPTGVLDSAVVSPK